VTNSTRPRGTDKRRQLTAAAASVLYHQGVERTTIADIAEAADVPAGNVYYYFKTKDDLVQAALTEHLAHLAELTDRLDRVPDPRERLKALVASWVDQRDVAARYGCPTGTLAAEIGKRADGTLDAAVGQVVRQLLNWVEEQFRQLGQPDPADLAVTLVAAYQGMSLLASALRDPRIVAREGARLTRWLDSLRQQAPTDDDF
jgi:TetR/AcrR family transcriptional regulator, transcriptional repressor for nem operon